MTLRLIVFLLCFLLAPAAGAGEVSVVKAEARYQGHDKFTFSVTLRHADTGWKHYADKWQVIDADGRVLGTRVLMHPHVNEQPFTRSLSGVSIPAGINRVLVRASDTKHGESSKTLAVDLPKR